MAASRCPFPVELCGWRLIFPAAMCDVTRASVSRVFIVGQPCRPGPTQLPSVTLSLAPPEVTRPYLAQGPTMNHSVSMKSWVWPKVKSI